jgi:very-short-patch-repair endonuclease
MKKRNIKKYDGTSVEDCLRYQRYLKRTFMAKVERASLYIEELNNRKTPSELQFEKLLTAWEIEFAPQYLVVPSTGKYIIADYYLPTYHLIVEIDGGIHKKPEVWFNDRFKEDTLKAIGFTNILRIKNEDLIYFTQDWLGSPLQLNL